MENLFEKLGEILKPQTDANTVLVAGLMCTRCKVEQKHFCEIVYSQGEKVCLECKKETLESDKRAFDRDMRFR